MPRFFQIVSFFFCYHLAHCIQPYFPPQVVFTVNNGEKLYAIDETNQRAYASLKGDFSQTGYVFQHFPYAPGDTPESNYYVQLVTGTYPANCSYDAYWKNGGNSYNLFPSHWDSITSF